MKIIIEVILVIIVIVFIAYLAITGTKEYIKDIIKFTVREQEKQKRK